MIFRKQFARCLAATFLLSGAAWAAEEPSLCGDSGYTVGFFNGVWNDKSGAEDGSQALEELLGVRYAGEALEHEAFYNETEGHMQDIVETFLQRAVEMEGTGALAERIEFFWELFLAAEAPLWARLVREVDDVKELEGLLLASVDKATGKAMDAMLQRHHAVEDYAEHRLRLDELGLQGRKLLLVGHSQGNLFLNPAYDYVSPKVGAEGVRAVHVAPASTTTRGPHVLADIDLVINALRIQGWENVPENNLVLPFSSGDPSGHQLRATYLDRTRPGRERVERELLSALSELVTPEPMASPGFFTVTLSWEGLGDVDLHVFEPDGGHVYYNYPGGTTGFLDLDNREGYGPEHYYASCYASYLQMGTYEIGLNNYAGADGQSATIQVASAKDGVVATRTLQLGRASGDSGDAYPEPIFFLAVFEDGAGKYRVEVIDALEG